MANIEFKPAYSGHYSVFVRHPRLGRHFELLIWLIVGGQPCISFKDFSFSKRYPDVGENTYTQIKNPDWDWLSVLPDREETVYQFIEEMWPKKRKHEARLKMLKRLYPALRLQQAAPRSSYSDRDKENWGFIGIKHEFERGYIPHVGVTSTSWSGHIDTDTLSWLRQESRYVVDKWYDLDYWIRLQAYIDSLPFLVRIEDLASCQWKAYYHILADAPQSVKDGKRKGSK